MKPIRCDDIATFLLADCKRNGYLTPITECKATAIDNAIRIRATTTDDRCIEVVSPITCIDTVTPEVLKLCEQVVMDASNQVTAAMREVNALLTA